MTRNFSSVASSWTVHKTEDVSVPQFSTKPKTEAKTKKSGLGTLIGEKAFPTHDCTVVVQRQQHMNDEIVQPYGLKYT